MIIVVPICEIIEDARIAATAHPEERIIFTSAPLIRVRSATAVNQTRLPALDRIALARAARVVRP